MLAGDDIRMSPDNFLDYPPAAFPLYSWLSPRISFSREFPDEDASNRLSPTRLPIMHNASYKKLEEQDPEISNKDFIDFEFRLEDPVAMLPANELFADGKLVPLQLSSIRHSAFSEARSPNEISSSRWKELIGLKKLHQNSSLKQEDPRMASSVSSNNNENSSRGLKHMLHRSSKSSMNTSLNQQLLKDSDNESISSSSGHEHDGLSRLSLDSEKPSRAIRNAHQSTSSYQSRVRLSKYKSENRIGRSHMRRAPETVVPARDVSVDSPRMNSSGKIVFRCLERSTNSFNDGQRRKHRGMERSYSANVRVTPVINVSVCLLRGSSKSGVFGFSLFASQ